MKYCGIIQFYNEMPENLPRAVASMRRVCGAVIGYDDGSTDGSGAWAQDNLDHVIVGRENAWKDEILHKQLMLERARQLYASDWILWLDADEVLSAPLVRYLNEREFPHDLTGIRIREVNLWRQPDLYRVDRSFGSGAFLRVFRPQLNYIVRSGLHQRQFPRGADRNILELKETPIIHYSWDSPEKIQAKYERYKAQGQRGENLDRLLDDPEAELVPVQREWFD